MTIELIIIIQMLIAAILGTFIYIILGIIPGTDETSVLSPITLLLLQLNIEPIVVLTFFIAGMVSLNLTDSIPTALTTIPGGVMSTPLIDASKDLKDKGLTTQSVKKMTLGSVIGTLVAIPSAYFIVLIFKLIGKQFDIESFVANNSAIIFFFGAIILSLISNSNKKRVISLIAIIPFSLIIGTIKKGNNIPMTPFFLAITTGPLIYSLFELLSPKIRNKQKVNGNMELELILDHNFKGNFFDILTKKEIKLTVLSSILASNTFFLSPVGMTLFIGDLTTEHIEDETEKSFAKVTVMNGLSNASYLAGILISLMAFKFPISPAALGPGGPLFDDRVGIIGKINNPQIMFAVFIGVIIALSITVFLTLRYADKMTALVFKYISHEAVLALLFSLVFLLVYIDTNILSIFLILIVSLISGWLNKKGVSYGVLFMALYAAPFIMGWF